MNKWTTRLHDKLRLDTYVIRINCQVLKTTLLSFSNSIAAGTKVFCFPSQRLSYQYSRLVLFLNDQINLWLDKKSFWWPPNHFHCKKIPQVWTTPIQSKLNVVNSDEFAYQVNNLCKLAADIIFKPFSTVIFVNQKNSLVLLLFFSRNRTISYYMRNILCVTCHNTFLIADNQEHLKKNIKCKLIEQMNHIFISSWD